MEKYPVIRAPLVQSGDQTDYIRDQMFRFYLNHPQIYEFYAYGQKFLHFFDGLRGLQGVKKVSGMGILVNGLHFASSFSSFWKETSQ